jgi:hypothetical protein
MRFLTDVLDVDETLHTLTECARNWQMAVPMRRGLSMKNARLCSMVLMLVSARASGQAIQNTPIAPPRAETTLSRSVVRITGLVEGVDHPISGTGFVVLVPEARLPGEHFVQYLVTNRHIAEGITVDAEGNRIKHRILKMEATVNLIVPLNGTKVHQVPLPPGGPDKWYFPTDDAIDLAVIPFAFDLKYDISRLSTALFLTADLWGKYGIVPGDKVMTCGYFMHYAGTHQFQPIVREGSLAMVPDDVINVPIGGKARVYLADLHIIPGNSGSPLFLAPASTLGGFVTDSQGGIPYGLIGIVSGYMWEDSSLTLHPATDFEATIHANSGIAVIVPVDQLKELLDSPEIQHQRDVSLADFIRQYCSTPTTCSR